LHADHRQYFDPQRYRAILVDQRGCGRSRPHASDPATDMTLNTTTDLISDMERLREHLGIERWLLSGSSWGSTLILAYAERYPHRVSEVVITGVTTTTRAEIDWLYRGLAHFLPGEWERFQAGVPQPDRAGDLVAVYARLMEDPDPHVRAQAADHWHTWEDATISLEPSGAPGSYSDRPPAELLARARICAHYFAHAAWQEEQTHNSDRNHGPATTGKRGNRRPGRRNLGTRHPPTRNHARRRTTPMIIAALAGAAGSSRHARRAARSIEKWIRAIHEVIQLPPLRRVNI
jgi:proline iminopeptidase